MKKILAVIVVLAITMISSMAFAADVTVSGSLDFRQRAFNNLDTNADNPDSDRDTQTRVRVNVDAKAGDAKARIQIQRNWEQWGETTGGFLNTDIAADNTAFSAIRESWLDTPLFGPVHLKGGHMLLALGNSWFLRNIRNGDDAWVTYADIGGLHIGLVDAKIVNRVHNNDSDFYAAVATQKLGEAGTVGVNFSHVVLAKKGVETPTDGGNILQNLGAHASVKLGPLMLKGELDVQMGKDKGDVATVDSKYKGNQLVIEGAMAMDPVTINFTAARGSGQDLLSTSPDMKEIVTVQDIDPHYTLMYEYKVPTAAVFNPYAASAVETGKHTGFANTTALSVGADIKLGSVTVGGNVWLLQATEKTNIGGALDALGNPILSDDLGIEIDARVNWKISDAVSWNVTMGYFMAGDAYARNLGTNGVNKDADEATGIQAVLGMKF